MSQSTEVVYTDPDEDVPSPFDLRTSAAAHAWAEAAETARPWRETLRLHIAALVCALPRGARVLELGSGPGLLAACVLARCPELAGYTLLDFSSPMLTMSRERVAQHAVAEFVQGDFKTARWWDALHTPYSAVVAMQSVHELRHKRHVAKLYLELHALLAPGGRLMVCDHAPKDDSLRWTSLHMTTDEQRAAFAAAGFVDTRVEVQLERLYLMVGTRP